MSKINTSIEDRIQIITLDDGGNALSADLLDELYSALMSSVEDQNLQAIIITGKKLFSAGGDVFGMQTAIDSGNQNDMVNQIISRAAKVILAILNHPLPIISAINRAAAGAGLSVAMACDHRVASSATKLIMAFGTLAIIPDSGASYLFPLRFGRSKTLRYCSSGQAITGSQGFEIGAIDELHENVLEGALSLAKEYNSSDRTTVAETKKLLNNKIIEEITLRFKVEEIAMLKMTARSEFATRVYELTQKLKA